MLIQRFPDSAEQLKAAGFAPFKLSKFAVQEIKSILPTQIFAVVKSREVDILELYTRGTEMLDEYDQVKRSVVQELAQELKYRCSHLLDIEEENLEISYFISRCTEGYHVGWHNDHRDERSLLSIPVYFNEGVYTPESGQLEFGYTHEIMNDNPVIRSTYPARDGYGALINAMDSVYSHRARSVIEGAVRYMICYSLIRKK